jgi:Predicted acetyltransferases and hydrolases with the alpha/beta hydrolase fold
VVGHSLGGLVAAYWLKQIDRGRRIRRVVTLGTPHRGTRFAWHGALLLGWVSRAPWQMIPGSSLLRELEMGPVPCGSELIAIASRHDSIVPRESARGMDAPRQRSIEISRAGHLDYLWSSDAFLSIAAALASPLPE